MKCHWTESAQPNYARVETSCGSAWGKSKADEFTICPECDCEIARGDYDGPRSTAKVRDWKPEPVRVLTIADAMPGYEWKMAESVRYAQATRQLLLGVSACPVPRGCNGPNLCDYDGVYATYPLPTFGTVLCRFNNPNCNYELRETAQRELQNKKQSANING